MKTRWTRVAWVVALLLVAPAAPAAEDVVEVLPVRNRPAADLVPLLRPLAGADGVVEASGDKLLVRASPAALAQIRQALAALDTTPRSLWISVRQGSQQSGSAAAAAGGVSVSGGRTTRVQATGAFAQGSGQSTSSDLQRLRALEGSPAFIRVGTAFPVPQVAIVPHPDGATVVHGTGYQDAETGFYVVPRVAGESVTLEISTRRDTPTASGAIATQDVDTTVSGRLGEWIALGAVSRTESGRETGVLTFARTQASDERTIFVMVEEVR